MKKGWVTEKPKKPYKIDLGSGNPAEGEAQASTTDFILQDIDPHPGISLVCDIRDLDTYVSMNSLSHCRLSHVLEHFGTKEVPTILTMLNKLIIPKGILEIHVPNFEWHMSLLNEGLQEEAVTYAFGGQLDEWDYHRTAFTPLILTKRVEEAGYTVDQLVPGTSISLIAHKTIANSS